MQGAVAMGKPVPEGMLAPMVDSAGLRDAPAALRRRLAQDGYLFLRGVVDPAVIAAARSEVLGRLEAVGEVRLDGDGVFTGRSDRRRLEPDLGRFWRSVSEGPAFRAACRGADVERVMTAVVGEAVRAQDFVFLRVGVPGRATGLHFDYPFFTRAHDQVWTVWLPIGAVPVTRGPIVVVEGSHRFADLVDGLAGFDVVRDLKQRRATVDEDHVAFAGARGARLLTADFAPGDLCLFGMYTLHGALDHHDPSGVVRISCDLRWQPAALPIDERYFGPDPTGTTGAGYAELNGAKPLDQPWHVR
jgi:hypothetical protein